MSEFTERVQERRLELVHREALKARLLTETQATIGLLVCAGLVTAVVLTMAPQLTAAAKTFLILLPTIFIGLMLLLAHRLGLAYEIIRRLEPSD